jgi:hypothetical protein
MKIFMVDYKGFSLKISSSVKIRLLKAAEQRQHVCDLRALSELRLFNYLLRHVRRSNRATDFHA